MGVRDTGWKGVIALIYGDASWERIRDNSYRFIFSAWVQICQIFDATLCSGSIELILCLWIVQAFLYRVQGHVHMKLQSLCNV